MISQSIRQLCALSLLCGAALSILPEGSVKRVAEVVCTASLIVALVNPLKALDMESYALESAKRQERETALISGAEATQQRLNRLVIEQEYEAYIMDKAMEMGFDGLVAEVEVQWSLDGLWMPYAVSLSGDCSRSGKEQLAALMTADLGIPYERQRWDSERRTEKSGGETG